MTEVQPPIIPIVGELAARTLGTISLGQGVVGFPPPPEALDGVERFWSDPENHMYGEVEGFRPLIEALQTKLIAENGIPVGRGSRVVVTAGSNMAFLHAVMAIADPGDEIILLTPYYFNHDMAIALAGCRTVAVPTSLEFQPDLAAIRSAITSRSRAVVTVSPNNPTGVVYPEETLRAVNALCRDHGIFHISDEVYEYFTYRPARHFSPGSIQGSEAYTISMFSFSKAYGMASWRVGYMTIPDLLVDAVIKIQDTVLVCPPQMSQSAALGALQAGRSYCASHLAGLEKVRDQLIARLAELDDRVVVTMPYGAFYALLRVRTSVPPLRFVERLILEHRVSAIPGTAFGVAEPCCLRIGYGALDEDTMSEGIGRLMNGIREISRQNS